MTKLIDTRLLLAAAQVTREWHSEDCKEWIRNDFAKFAKPFWMKWGGVELVDHMMGKYVNNDRLSIVEYLYNLDDRNRALVAKYLLDRESGRSEYQWTVYLEED